MAIFETFAARKRAAQRAGQPDVYQYDELPPFLRKQIALVWDEAIGPYWEPRSTYVGSEPAHANRLWELMHDTMLKEVESFEAHCGEYLNARERCMNLLRSAAEVDDVLSIIELSCRILNNLARENDLPLRRGAKQAPAEALDEINHRFLQHGVGYQFVSGEIIRVDSQYVHAEVVKPALALLADKLFEKANADFMTAHRHYRNGDYKDVSTAAQRAFESTLKAICHETGWSYGEGDTAARLVTICRNNGLFPTFLDDGINTYVSMLRTGLPGVRNNAGGHGEAPTAPPVAEHIAGYALHMTAANIVLAINAYKAMV